MFHPRTCVETCVKEKSKKSDYKIIYIIYSNWDQLFYLQPDAVTANFTLYVLEDILRNYNKVSYTPSGVLINTNFLYCK